VIPRQNQAFGVDDDHRYRGRTEQRLQVSQVKNGSHTEPTGGDEMEEGHRYLTTARWEAGVRVTYLQPSALFRAMS
jgi:hypothetical protein